MKEKGKKCTATNKRYVFFENRKCEGEICERVMLQNIFSLSTFYVKIKL
jgi:hypothetical protein